MAAKIVVSVPDVSVPLTLFPFYTLSSAEFELEFNNINMKQPTLSSTSKFKNAVSKSQLLADLEFKYYTPCQFNSLASTHDKKIQLSVFHLNIRSLNANHKKLIELLECIDLNFDVIVLSEVWRYNLEFYGKLLNNYTFFFLHPL